MLTVRYPIPASSSIALFANPLTVDLRQSAHGGLFVQLRQRATCFKQNQHGIIKGYPVKSTRKKRKTRTTDCPRRGVGIPFNAGDLHETGHRIAGHPEMRLQTHFGGLLDLLRRVPEDLRLTSTPVMSHSD